MKNLKIFLFIIFVVLFSSCKDDEEYTQDSNTDELLPEVSNYNLAVKQYSKFIKSDEYINLSENEKTVVDAVNTGVLGLEAISLTHNDKQEKYAMIDVSLKKRIFLPTLLFISELKPQKSNIGSTSTDNFAVAETKKCRSCGWRGHAKCARKMVSDLVAGESVLVKITKEEDGCYSFEW